MKQAFSLVELSIVLVILGLLTGGILTGQTLIRAAELRAVSTEYQRYQSATNTFRDKYFAIPGDMRNAESFWGTFSNGSCPTGSGVGTETCNGDGDGVIEGAAGANQAGEIFTFWQQLANAGLIEGTFTGLAGSSGGSQGIVGDNVPRSKLSQAGWYIEFVGTIASGDTRYFEGDYGHFYTFGGTAGTGQPDGAVMLAEELWNLDTKLDDGRPAYGTVRSLEARTTCNTSTVASTAEYNLTNTGTNCTGLFNGD